MMNKYNKTQIKKLIQDSFLFDKVFYIAEYRDVRVSSVNPFEHFCEFGINEDRKPNQNFDPVWYKNEYANQMQQYESSLIHFIEYGNIAGNFLNEKEKKEYIYLQKQGFNSDFYKNEHEDLKNQNSDFNGLLHYIRYGKKEGRKSKFENSLKHNLFEGRVEKFEGGVLVGWATCKDNTDMLFHLKVLIDGSLYCEVENNIFRNDLLKNKKSNGVGGFCLSIPNETLNENAQIISIVLPNDIILWKKKVSNPKILDVPAISRLKISQSVSVIVPIYNASEDVKICINRLLKYTNNNIELILIDDASTDSEISQILTSIKDYKNIKIIKNSSNLGYTKTINKGIKIADTNDVILLNSDARVTPKWLEGLRNVLSTDEHIGTITPMSDRAGAFSAPLIGNENPIPLGVTEEEYSLAFRRKAYGFYTNVPTGNGFCMYIRRSCIEMIGLLDEQAFPKGYGEENDFCMRARAQGWRNVIDDRTYVFHERSQSFGEQKIELMQSGRKKVDKRYPDYSMAIKVFSQASKLSMSRFKALQALKMSSSNQVLPRSLYVVSTLTGGTPQTNKDLMFSLLGVIEPWLLHCNGKVMSLYKVTAGFDLEIVAQQNLNEEVEPLTHKSFEYDKTIEEWMIQYDFQIIHIRHLGWHSLSLPKIAKQLGVQVVLSFHDFYTICPSIKLLNEFNQMCNCNPFKTKIDSFFCKVELWAKDSLPNFDTNWSKHWKDNFSKVFNYCDAFITTSLSAKNTIMKAFSSIPDENFYIIPHGRTFDFSQIDINYKHKKPFQILVPGNIDVAKGLDVIKNLLEADTEKRLEFHIMGSFDESYKHPRLKAHGKYIREDFAKIAEKINPTVGAVFSIWDETWCHTLTELWSIGIPVIALDYGTISQRIKSSGAGWVYKFSNVEKLYKNLITDLSNKQDFKKKVKAVKEWQDGLGTVHDNEFMASSYLAIYKKTIFNSTNRNNQCNDKLLEKKIAVVCPANEKLTKAPGSTHIRVWEKTKNNLYDDFVYIKMTAKQLIACLHLKLIKHAIIQRNVLLPEEWGKIKPYVMNNELTYILDIDDDLLNVPEDKDPTRTYKEYVPTLTDIIINANQLSVSTENLYRKYTGLNKNIKITPNVLSSEIWKGDLEKKETIETCRAVYIGSNTHLNDLLMVLPALEEVKQIYPNFELKVIGVLSEIPKNFPYWIDIVSVPNESKNYPEFVKFIKQETQDVDFGIVPLEITPFNNTKSPLKIMEYAALALPLVVSDGEVYSDFAKQSPYVKIANNSSNSWVRAMSDLIDNKTKLASWGEEMRSWVFAKYMIKKENILSNILREIFY